MASYVVRRLLLSVPTLVVVSVLVFVLVRLQPGDVIVAQAGQAGALSPADEQRIREDLGLDRPAPVQYVAWLGNVVRGGFGESFYTRQPVRDLVWRRIPVSLELMIGSLVVALVIAIPLGAGAAYWRNSPFDYLARAVSVVGLSIPDFFFGMLVIIFLVSQFGWLPALNYTPITEDPLQNLEQFIIPILIVGYRYAALTARMTRSAVLEVINQDYIRTARAKGLRDKKILMSHVSRNSMIPVITVIGNQMIALFSALVVIEVVFVLPGMGSMTFAAVQARDYPVVQATVLIFAIMAVLTNTLVDVAYAIIDPRIRYS